MKIKIIKSLLYPIILCAVVAIFLGLNYLFYGNLILDCGREFIVPEAMLQGKILIKDIFITYFPLSYQINALLFKIFGAKLDTLRIIGSITAILDILIFYLILRYFVSKKKAFSIAFIISAITMFNASYLYNYVLGYSYACIYAVFFLSLSVYFAFYYIQTGRVKVYFTSILLAGVCFALKAEYVFLIIPYILLGLYKKQKVKTLALAGLTFIIPVILSFIALFISGFRFNDFIGYIEFMKNFMKSKVFQTFTANAMMKDIRWFQFNILNLAKTIALFGILFGALYFPIKLHNKWIYYISSVVIISSLSAYFVLSGGFLAISLFSYLLIFNLIIATLLIILIKRNEITDGARKKIESVLFLILIQTALLIRYNFIYTPSHGAYLMWIGLIPAFLGLFILIKNKFFKRALLSSFIIISIINIGLFTCSNLILSRFQVKTDKGEIRISNINRAEIIGKTLTFLEHVDKDKTVLILPEGHMLNFLADRKTNLKYYQLLPNHIEALGEDNIINDLEKDKPDYILFTTENYSIYGTPYICKNFGEKICNFALKNYSQIKVFSNKGEFRVFAYKLKG